LVGSSERGLRLGQFAVDLWSDMPPVHKSLLERRSPKRVKTFDLRGLLQDVKQEFERAPQDETREIESCELSRSLLRRLILSWSKTREREFARTRLNFELTVKVGLAAIHQHIGGTEAPAISSTSPAPRLAAEWQSPEDQMWSESLPDSMSLSPIDSQLSRGSSLHRRRAQPEQRPKANSSVTDWLNVAKEQRNESYRVSTSNESAGGYCIQWPAAKNSKVRIGEILGIQTGSDRNQLSLGVVRWLEQVPGDDLILGVHIIAQRCAIGRLLGNEDKKDTARHEYRCILLPEDDAGDRHSGLLLQAAEVPPGADMQLLTDAGAEPIHLTRVVESTGSFTHIQFTYVKDKVPNKAGAQGGDDGFEDLWGNI
jgi:hypothetical protein